MVRYMEEVEYQLPKQTGDVVDHLRGKFREWSANLSTGTNITKESMRPTLHKQTLGEDLTKYR